MTAGGIAEALEDDYESHHGVGRSAGQGITPTPDPAAPDAGTITPIGSRRRAAQLGDSSEPRVSKTS